MKPGVKAIYKKPLSGELQGDVDHVLGRMKGQFIRRLKVQLQQSAFSPEAKRALAKAMTIEVKKSSLVVTVHHPAWRPLVEGQRKGPMFWLQRAKAPIPIVTETGEVIFRVATPKSLASGKWVHPGRKPATFVEKARREAKEWAKKALPDLLRREIGRTLQGK